MNELRDADAQSVLKREQLAQAVQTYRTQFSLLVQVGTVLVTGSLTVLGLGVSVKSSGVATLSLFFLAALIVMFRQTRVTMKPVVFSAVSLEHELGAGARGLATTFISLDSSHAYVDEILRINRLDEVERATAISAMRPPNLGPISTTMYFVFWAFTGLVAAIALWGFWSALAGIGEWSVF